MNDLLKVGARKAARNMNAVNCLYNISLFKTCAKVWYNAEKIKRCWALKC